MLTRFKRNLLPFLCVGLSLIIVSCGTKEDKTEAEMQKLKEQVDMVTVGYEDGSTILLNYDSTQYKQIVNECLEAMVSIDEICTLSLDIDYVEEKWKPENKYVQIHFDGSIVLVTTIIVQEEERYRIPHNTEGFQLLNTQTVIFPLSNDDEGLIWFTNTESTTYSVWENYQWSSLKLDEMADELRNPVKIVSVQGPLEPINPSGPTVEITLQNTSSKAITSLNATLKLNRDFMFEFDVSSSKPLLPGESINSRLTLIGGGFSTDTSYSLQIEGEFEDGATFNCTRQVQITEP